MTPTERLNAITIYVNAEYVKRVKNYNGDTDKTPQDLGLKQGVFEKCIDSAVSEINSDSNFALKKHLDWQSLPMTDNTQTASDYYFQKSIFTLIDDFSLLLGTPEYTNNSTS